MYVGVLSIHGRVVKIVGAPEWTTAEKVREAFGIRGFGFGNALIHSEHFEGHELTVMSLEEPPPETAEDARQGRLFAAMPHRQQTPRRETYLGL